MPSAGDLKAGTKTLPKGPTCTLKNSNNKISMAMRRMMAKVATKRVVKRKGSLKSSTMSTVMRSLRKRWRLTCAHNRKGMRMATATGEKAMVKNMAMKIRMVSTSEDSTRYSFPTYF